MRFLCDHNIGSVIARALAEHGHDVERAVSVTPGASDDAVLAYAVRHQRILITCDSDFGERVFLRRAAPPPAIIYVRFEPQSVADIVPRLLDILDEDALRDHMTVIGEYRNRRTSFPAWSNDHG